MGNHGDIVRCDEVNPIECRHDKYRLLFNRYVYVYIYI
jgi:hypothetical protein